jgi:hypothetical protein
VFAAEKIKCAACGLGKKCDKDLNSRVGDEWERDRIKNDKSTRSRPGHVREAGDGCLQAVLKIL